MPAVRPWIAPFVLLALLSPASAQAPALETSLTISLGEAPAPLDEETDVDVPYRIEYVTPPNGGGLTVSLSPDVPGVGWHVLAVPATHTTPGGPTLGGTTILEGVLRIRHDGTPRAFTSHEFVVRADAPGDGFGVRPADATATTAITPAWRPGLHVVTSTSSVPLRGSGGEDFAHAEIRNTGNGDVRLRVDVLRAPERCNARSEASPSVLALGARANLRVEILCDRGFVPGSLAVRVAHEPLGDTTRSGTPVEPVWEVVEGEPGRSIGGGRAFGDEPRDVQYNQTSWGAVLLVPSALVLAALTRSRR